jgi:hypothetical protein
MGNGDDISWNYERELLVIQVMDQGCIGPGRAVGPSIGFDHLGGQLSLF